MPNVNVQVQTTNGIHKVTINPERLRVPHGSTNVVITWNATGPTTFLAGNDAFKWLSPGAPAVTRIDDSTLRSASFDNNNSAEVIWRYLIGVEEGGVKIQVDPEVDNDPPAML